MTMPKFEPVAHMQVSVEVGVGTYFPRLHKPEKYNADLWRLDPLYSADQLTEAYEAGKREAIPEGWVLVPKVPTEEMLIAGMETPCTASDEDWRDDYVDVYKSMLAAAPKGEE